MRSLMFLVIFVIILENFIVKYRTCYSKFHQAEQPTASTGRWSPTLRYDYDVMSELLSYKYERISYVYLVGMQSIYISI